MLKEVQALIERWRKFSETCEFRGEGPAHNCKHHACRSWYSRWRNVNTCPGGDEKQPTKHTTNDQAIEWSNYDFEDYMNYS